MPDVITLMLADSRTPTGGYAHSGGLEAALEDGLAPEAIPGFMEARLRTVGFVDAAFAAAGARADGAPQLAHLEREWSARTPAPALRHAAQALGRALLRLCQAVGLGGPGLSAWAIGSPNVPRCIVLGAAMGGAGGDPEDAARLSLYDDAAMVCSAAPKLISIDALTTTAWLAARASLISRLARAAANADGLPSTATPGLDRLAERHTTAPRRLFAS
jgi:urease accessory protein